MLGPLVGAAAFTFVGVLLALSLALLITFPLALPFIWPLFMGGQVLGAFERSRLESLLGLSLPSPARAAGCHGMVAQAGRARSQWQPLARVALMLVLFPRGLGAFVLTYVVVSGSIALIALPLYLLALPDGSANFGAFEVSSHGAAVGWATIGLLVLVVGAPWLIRGLGRIHVALARLLPEASRQQSLEAAVTRLEASRSAAVDSADVEATANGGSVRFTRPREGRCERRQRDGGAALDVRRLPRRRLGGRWQREHGCADRPPELTLDRYPRQWGECDGPLPGAVTAC